MSGPLFQTIGQGPGKLNQFRRKVSQDGMLAPFRSEQNCRLSGHLLPNPARLEIGEHWQGVGDTKVHFRKPSGLLSIATLIDE